MTARARHAAPRRKPNRKRETTTYRLPLPDEITVAAFLLSLR